MDRIAEETGTNRSTGESIYNQLRDSGEIPKGGRGVHALRISSAHAAKYLIAICCAEHVKDAANAVRRYAVLEEAGYGFRDNQGHVPLPGITWESISDNFPRLAKLPSSHTFFEALVAIIDSYIDAPERDETVTVTFGGPFPWAKASVSLANRGVALQYNAPKIQDDEGHSDDDDEFLATIDPSKERQRRRFAKLGGDLRLTTEVTHRTLSALGDLLRGETA
ncbi:MAG: hypothetical protein WBB98_12110 [Xanthobacteraceae bacterium]